MINNRCISLTKKKTQCKNMCTYQTIDGVFSYCHLHSPIKTESCCICLSSIKNAYYLPCGHYFHDKCISKWLKYNNTCPVCRENIDKTTLCLLKCYFKFFDNLPDDILSIAINLAFYSVSKEDLLNTLITLNLLKTT